jgi:NAD(P)-dependent dehydrogenase (short-subunit alcohol dehydrogenase family)
MSSSVVSADFIAADLADASSVRALARRATELGGGRVDILVNNAGVFPFGPTPGASDRTSTRSTPSTSRRPSS